MKSIALRLVALERARIGHRGPAEVVRLLTAAQADEVAVILASCGDDVLEDVIAAQLRSQGYSGPLTDELLASIADGN